MQKLQKFLNQHKNPKILDVGTGRGSFISIIDHLYKDYEKIVGIDISKRAIDMATEAFKDNPKIKFVERDILNTGFPEGHFDIVCLANSLHHLDKIPETFKAMNSLLKPDGEIIVFEMLSDNLTKAQVSHKLIHHFAAKIDRILGRTHNDTYTKDEIIKILGSQENLKLVDSYEFDFPQEEPTEEDVQALVKQVDQLKNQLGEKANEFDEEANSIKAYINENKFASCTSFIVILKKTN